MRKEIQEKLSHASQSQIILGDMNITDEELNEIIFEIKKIRPRVEDIFLDNNQITDIGAMLISTEFSKLSNLSFIDLQFNKIDKKGATAIFTLKKTHPNLTIALHGNLIINAADMLEIEKPYK